MKWAVTCVLSHSHLCSVSAIAACLSGSVANSRDSGSEVWIGQTQQIPASLGHPRVSGAQVVVAAWLLGVCRDPEVTPEVDHLRHLPVYHGC